MHVKILKKNTQLYCNLLSKYLGQYFIHYLKALPRIYPTDDAELIEIVKEKYLIHLKKAKKPKYVGDAWYSSYSSHFNGTSRNH